MSAHKTPDPKQSALLHSHGSFFAAFFASRNNPLPSNYAFNFLAHFRGRPGRELTAAAAFAASDLVIRIA